MKIRELISVGIDVGTTTTQVIFSCLALVNRAAISQVPRYEFVKREITWQSPVFFTPVDVDGHLREDELLSLILAQYQAAGIAPETIDSGAIIITGETAKTRNARPAVMALAQRLGDFVVATAGPHLESVIAGYGSGAQALSQRQLNRVMNIDIGGGTANYVLFEGGKVVASACLNVGGRLFETDTQGNVTFLHRPGQWIADELFGEGKKTLTPAQLETVADRMAQLLYEVIAGEISPLSQRLLMTDALPAGKPADVITLSGGVGECYRQPPETPFIFGDIGPLLAQAIHRHAGFASLPVQVPDQTVRATVIGAGAHTLSLSGSTIWLDELTLPLRNIPVVHPVGHDGLAENWQQGLALMDLNATQDSYALAIPPELSTSYATVQLVINAVNIFTQRNPGLQPLIVVAEQDLGKALGMLLYPQMEQRKLAVIDEVVTRTGDYIDIGLPLFGGAVVPVTIKSLAFPS
ncbi:ethanolamine ammonia-lyase reactivating factor EutA [Buttiauxella sp. S04-F03]|uniref:ethanolamine ammonia-lyase reactivating factor EutA n=1 Tax=Buttiauxella sp. W03-F01 TaxID=2904524 RepID=UPI001E3832DD|nr:ethanolamine ammonia-lyase reactivating factor EutA [Buttiauxella sp. W03-F01]